MKGFAIGKLNMAVLSKTLGIINLTIIKVCPFDTFDVFGNTYSILLSKWDGLFVKQLKMLSFF